MIEFKKRTKKSRNRRKGIWKELKIIRITNMSVIEEMHKDKLIIVRIIIET